MLTQSNISNLYWTHNLHEKKECLQRMSILKLIGHRNGEQIKMLNSYKYKLLKFNSNLHYQWVSFLIQ